MPKVSRKKVVAECARKAAIPMSISQARAALEPPVPSSIPQEKAGGKPATVPGREGKVKRKIKILWSNGAYSVVRIWQEDRPGCGMGHTDEYMVEKIGAGFWCFQKLDPTVRVVYTVFLGTATEPAVSCSCKGFRGHGQCKHSAGLDCLISRGELS